jgi:hypothetical protein
MSPVYSVTHVAGLDPTPNPSPQGGGEHTECVESILRQRNGMRSSRYIDTGVPMKSRLPISTPQWRAMS